MIFCSPKIDIKAKEGRLLRKDGIEEIGEPKTQLFITLILIPLAYKLNDIVGKPHKILALISKIQNKHKHNDNQLNNKGSHFKH